MKVEPEQNITPDCWVVFETDGNNIQYKRVLAGWHGDYVSGSSYRRSTPIVEEAEDEHNLIFKTRSGSTYICRKNAEALMGATSEVYQAIKQAGDEAGIKVKLTVYGDQT